jgi:hypothetical protein
MYVKSDRPNGTSRQYYPMLQRTKLHILELNDKNASYSLRSDSEKSSAFCPTISSAMASAVAVRTELLN